MKTANRLSLIAAFAVLAGVSSVSLAAPTAWTTPAGNQTNFTYSNGQNLTNNAGTGNAKPSGDGFFFTPPGLIAIGSNGLDQQGTRHAEASDTISVILNAKPTFQFTSVSANLAGDYSTLGVGFASASSTLRLTNLDTAATSSQVLNFGSGGNFNSGTTPAGTFSGLATIAIPDGWKNVKLELDALVAADTLFGSTVIQAKNIGFGIVTGNAVPPNVEVPVPAAIFAAPIAAYMGYKAQEDREAVTRDFAHHTSHVMDVGGASTAVLCVSHGTAGFF